MQVILAMEPESEPAIMGTVRWGILSTAKIGVEKVIPAIQKAADCTVSAIASRTLDRAEKYAEATDIPRCYGTYQELLSDPRIDVIYNPLPNHLHVPWSIKALQAGKHVLCEKPVALSAVDAQTLKTEADKYSRLKIMEAFMYRFHPQWKAVLKLIRENRIGELKSIQSFFSYYNDDPENIRNIEEMGGGGLMDIGCYCISLSRYLYGSEPERVIADMKMDPRFGVDHTTSAILDFGSGYASFTCSTRSAPDQRVHITGTGGCITIELPFNAPAGREMKVHLVENGVSRELTFGPADQYTLQAEAFVSSIIDNKTVPTPLNDAINNMMVIDCVKESARTGQEVVLSDKRKTIHSGS